MKLLIADDHPTNLRLLRAQLEADGHEVVEAPNGAEALRLLRSQAMDGVISDILMPEMDGYRFCIEVRGDPVLRDLPVVLYTSTYNSPADRQLALNAGADAYISKPAPLPVILDALKKAAGGKRRPPAGDDKAGEAGVLRKYSEALVRKLEDKNIELERTLERLSVMHEIDQAIITVDTPAQIAEAALPRLRDLLGMPRVIVNMFDLEKNEAEWLVAVGRERTHVGPGVRFSLEVMGDVEGLKRGEAQHIDVAALSQRAEAEALLASGVRWFMVVPMIVGDELIGGLSFGGPSAEFAPQAIEIAREAAAQLAIAIQQSRLKERARQADAQYRVLFENVPVGVTLTAADGRFLSMSPALPRILGYASVEEVMAGLQGSALGVYGEPGAREAYLTTMQRDGVVSQFETRFIRKDGSLIWVSMSGRPLGDQPDGTPVLVTIIDDISQRKEHEHRIARLSRVKEMQSAMNVAIVRTHEWQGLLEAGCRIAVEQGGLRAAWIVWHDESQRRLKPAASAGVVDGFLEIVETATDQPETEAAGFSLQVLRGGVAICTNDLRTAPNVAFREEALSRGYMATLHLPLTSGGRAQGVLVLCATETEFFDDEERVLLDELAADLSFALDALQKTERLHYLAFYDPLTGLPNRSLFHDRLSQGLHARGGDERLVAVVLLDVERFRRVNETLGRTAGDELLREIGERLKKANDSAARIGVDMFGLVLRGARTAAEASRALEAVIGSAFVDNFRFSGQDLRVACRAGVAVFPNDGADADTLLKNAEAALRRSKREGERLLFYAPDMNARAAEALAMETRLRRAVERGEFVLHYQPKISLDLGGLAGVEALIRWQDPEVGLVPPGRFIPILEETGMIVEVGRWAVQQAFVDAHAWAKSGLKVPRVAVNVSAIQLQRHDFVDVIVGEIERGGDMPEWLELEITESLVMRNVEDSTRKLSIVRGMGVTIAIDDFGTGYSSLAYLSRLPVDKLKIDRSFVSNVTASGEATTLVTTMIGLAHGLKLKVVAEGVETEEQATLLRLFRCDEAQGYLYSKPVPADALAALLRTGSFGKK